MGEWLQVGPRDDRAYLAVPENGNGAGVLVLHAWWGLTQDITDVCDRLAAEGFVALAPSLYADGATTASVEEAEALAGAHNDPEGVVESVAKAAVAHLRGLPEVTLGRIGVIGFSLGAFWALHLSEVLPGEVMAVVPVYGTGGGDFKWSRSAYLGHFASDDDFEPREDVQALESRIRAAGRPVEFHVYPGTGHWFAEPSRSDAYNAEATELVWERTLAFLRERLLTQIGATLPAETDLLDQLLGHDQWTTNQLLDLSRDLTDEQLDRKFDIGLETLRETFDHMIFNIDGWTSMMARDRPPEERPEQPSIEELRQRHDRFYARFAALARKCRDEQRLAETFVDYYAFPQSIGATINHVILHNHQHRSEVLHILKRLGVENLPEGDLQEWQHLTGRI